MDEGTPEGYKKELFPRDQRGKEGCRHAPEKDSRGAVPDRVRNAVFKKITPAAPVKDLKKATIALVSSGGIVPKGNPDHIRVSSAETYGVYDISRLDDLTPDNFESIHGGYDRVWANDDPDAVLPLDVMREMEKEGVFGKLYDLVFTTTGTGTAVAHAERFGREIGEKLKKDGVDAVILTST